MLSYENTRQCGRAGSSSSSRCRVFPGTEASAENRYAFGRQLDQRETLEADVESGRRGRIGRQAASRSGAQTFRETTTVARRDPLKGTDCGRISNRSMDVWAGFRGRSQAVPSFVPSRPRAADSARSWFLAAKATACCPRARQRSRREMATASLAADQKKARRRGANIVFLDESGFRLQPVNRRTWAPRGETPVQRAWDRYDRLSVIGAVTLSPTRRRIGAPFQIYDDNIRTDEVVEFIRQLRKQFQRPLIICLDRWQVHRSAAKRIAQSRLQSIEFEWLPAYAPELNPVEPRWSHTKYSDLANFVPDDVSQLKRNIRSSLKKQLTNPQLKSSFFKSAKLKL